MKEKIESAKNIVDIESRVSKMSKHSAEYVDKSMALARYISDFAKSSEFKQTEVATKLGKHVSEISKWVSGIHNLTVSSILKLESVSSIQLLNPAIFIKSNTIQYFKNENAREAVNADHFPEVKFETLDSFLKGVEEKTSSQEQELTITKPDTEKPLHRVKQAA